VVRTSVFGRRTFPAYAPFMVDVSQTAGLVGTGLVGKLSAMGQPTGPTQPSILLGSVNE